MGLNTSNDDIGIGRRKQQQEAQLLLGDRDAKACQGLLKWTWK